MPPKSVGRWIADPDRPYCTQCSAAFWFFKRRHHCRNCGDVFCAACCSKTMVVPMVDPVKQQRVCDGCHLDHESYAGRLSGLQFSDADVDDGNEAGRAESPSRFVIPEATDVPMRDWVLSMAKGALPKMLAGSPFKSPEALLLDIEESVFSRQDAKDAIERHGLAESEALACALMTAPCPGLFEEANRRLHQRRGIEAFIPFLVWLHKGLDKLEVVDGVVFRLWDTHQDKGVQCTAGKGVTYNGFACATTQIDNGFLKKFSKGVTIVALEVRGACRVTPLSCFPQYDEVVLLPGWSGNVGGVLADSERTTLSQLHRLDLRHVRIIEVQQMGFRRRKSSSVLLLEADKLEVLLGENPNQPAAHHNLGTIMERHLEDYDGARRHFEAALELDPKLAESHLNLGLLLVKVFHEDEEAKKHFEATLELEPSVAAVVSAHNALGTMCERAEQFAEARAHYEAALRAKPEDPIAHENLRNMMDVRFRSTR